MLKLAVFTTFIFLNVVSVKAEIRLPAIISDHMVLQQNAEVKLWGWCNPGEKISVRLDWDTTTYFVTGDSHAKWNIKIKTTKAGGPFSIQLKGSNVITINDVLLGEVWLCSGQSNMEMHYNWGLKQYITAVKNATDKSIRFFQVLKATAENPQDDLKGKWVVCNPEDVKSFSLVAYFFGKVIREKMDVPVGLINASWGGTPAEAWTPKEIIDSDTSLQRAAAALKPSNGWPISPALSYNAMIYPIKNYSIAGVTWYQGESNVGTAQTYRQLFTSMIGAWRNAWKQDLPFYYVQIAPYAGYGNGISSARLREAQTASLGYPKTGMIVISDLVDNINDIHPKMKQEVGERLATYVLADLYKKDIVSYKSPMYESMKIEQDKIRIYFKDAETGLITKSGLATDFFIAGDDKVYVPAEAKIEKSTVVVSSKLVKKPVAVRFGFTNSSIPNLFSRLGLPVSIFRTDTWDVDTEPRKK